jgi:VanZ family protein
LKDSSSILAFINPFSVILGLAISILQLYVTSRQAKLKETIIELFRKELEAALIILEKRIQEWVDLKIRIAKEEVKNEIRHG